MFCYYSFHFNVEDPSTSFLFSISYLRNTVEDRLAGRTTTVGNKLEIVPKGEVQIVPELCYSIDLTALQRKR